MDSKSDIAKELTSSEAEAAKDEPVKVETAKDELTERKVSKDDLGFQNTLRTPDSPNTFDFPDLEFSTTVDSNEDEGQNLVCLPIHNKASPSTDNNSMLQFQSHENTSRIPARHGDGTPAQQINAPKRLVLTSFSKLQQLDWNDVNALRFSGNYLTDTNIREILRKQGETMTDLSGYHVFDPSWSQIFWDSIEDNPTIFYLFEAPTRLSGLIIPLYRHNHWMTLVIDIAPGATGVVVFNSLDGETGAYYNTFAIEFLQRFMRKYPGFFVHFVDETRILRLPPCTLQPDSTSCGIYTVENIVALLRMDWPHEESNYWIDVGTYREYWSKVLEDTIYLEALIREENGPFPTTIPYTEL